jgi:shikimate dehydrogenase
VLRDGRCRAENTDIAGIVATLGRAGVRPGGRAVVLGAGGTAQAALAALADLGIDEVTVLVRSLARTGELRDTAARLGTSPTIRADLADPVRGGASLTGADVVVSTLPGDAADPLPGLRTGSVVLDVVYAPWPTRFAAAAAADGATVVSGLEMLLHQAVAQVELMTGEPGPVEPMRAALETAVAARV